jgi:hypothetical protein
MKSICSKENSRTESMEKTVVDKLPKKKKSVDHLPKNYLDSTENSYSKSAYITNPDMLNKILTSYVSNGQVKCFQVDENDV